ncbi:MAG: hypothetical protein NZ529_04505 [Cytophagaceae bacterium]|nr:hypothetical protein [Cytophagaceae bacterium]MDW8456036.1 hypothetical protein [Cytophagaceae bacterium]
MFKYSFVFSATLVIVALSSCKKDYTCTCTGEHGEEEVRVLENVTKAQAKSKCVNYEEEHGNHSHEFTCKLK